MLHPLDRCVSPDILLPLPRMLPDHSCAEHDLPRLYQGIIEQKCISHT